MADAKISDLPALTTPTTGDLMVLVDISDTTDDSAGSSVKATVANVLSNGLKDAVFSGNNQLLYRNNSGSVAVLSMAERDAIYRAASGTVTSNNGRNFLDTVMRGGTSDGSQLNYQPHYNVLWQPSGNSVSVSWQTDGTTSQISWPHLYNAAQQSGTGSIQLPSASSAFEGDRIWVHNRRFAMAGGQAYMNVSLAGGGSPDEQQVGNTWRLWPGEFMGFECQENADTSTYHWYQIAGTPLDRRKEFFSTAASVDFTADTLTAYTPGEARVRTTATGQTHTLPPADDNRRYEYEFYYSASDAGSVTIDCAGSDTIIEQDGTTSRTSAEVSLGPVLRLFTNGDSGVWYSMNDDSGVTFS